MWIRVVSIFLFAILPSSLQHPLSVPAGRLNGRAETLPVGFWVTRRPSHEILTRLSPSGENDPTGKRLLVRYCMIPVETTINWNTTRSQWSYIRFEVFLIDWEFIGNGIVEVLIAQFGKHGLFRQDLGAPEIFFQVRCGKWAKEQGAAGAADFLIKD